MIKQVGSAMRLVRYGILDLPLVPKNQCSAVIGIVSYQEEVDGGLEVCGML